MMAPMTVEMDEILLDDDSSPEASLEFSRSENSDRHTYKCPLCPFRSYQNYKLVRHTKAVHTKEKPYKCNICNLSFLENCVLSRHVKVVHNKQRDFVCDICDKSFASNANLKQHTDAVHEKLRPFECSYCGANFGSKGVLYNHVQNKHLETRFECPVCRKSLKSKKSLHAHVTSVHNKDKLVHCELCSKGFGSQNSLQRHIDAVHDGVKPLRCNECDFRTATNWQLIVHKKSHGKETKRAPLRCDVCGAEFSYLIDVVKHKTEAHESEQQNAAVSSSSSCESRTLFSNDTIFASASPDSPSDPALGIYRSDDVVSTMQPTVAPSAPAPLIVERATTNGKTPRFVCPICGGPAFDRRSLRTHIAEIHQKGQPQICKLCGMVLGNKHDLNRHSKNVHGGVGAASAVPSMPLSPKTSLTVDSIGPRVIDQDQTFFQMTSVDPFRGSEESRPKAARRSLFCGYGTKESGTTEKLVDDMDQDLKESHCGIEADEETLKPAKKKNLKSGATWIKGCKVLIRKCDDILPAWLGEN